jgi:hypothetical protein
MAELFGGLLMAHASSLNFPHPNLQVYLVVELGEMLSVMTAIQPSSTMVNITQIYQTKLRRLVLASKHRPKLCVACGAPH